MYIYLDESGSNIIQTNDRLFSYRTRFSENIVLSIQCDILDSSVLISI